MGEKEGAAQRPQSLLPPSRADSGALLRQPAVRTGLPCRAEESVGRARVVVVVENEGRRKRVAGEGWKRRAG